MYYNNNDNNNNNNNIHIYIYIYTMSYHNIIFHGHAVVRQEAELQVGAHVGVVVDDLSCDIHTQTPSRKS